MKLTKKYIADKLLELSKLNGMDTVDIGLTGSWVRDENNDENAIHVVLNLKLKEDVSHEFRRLLTNYSSHEEITNVFLKKQFDCNIIVSWLHNLEDEDKKLDIFMKGVGLPFGSSYSSDRELINELEWVSYASKFVQK